MRDTQQISASIKKLEANLSQTARVEEWAELMGYKCPKKFARKFLRYYSVRPIKMLEFIRLRSIACQLRQGLYSNFEIARNHGIPDEIALNKFVNYHLGCSPSMVKRLSENQLEEKLKKFGSSIR
jgi:transcriptional regulator GlxA family with amidase domain